MPADDNVLHLQVQDGVHDDGLGGEVRGREDVGDVAVDEDVTRLEAQDGGFGHAGVGAAEPEDFRVLACGEGGEEVGVRLGGLGGPLFVLVEGEGERIGCWWGREVSAVCGIDVWMYWIVGMVEK